MLLREIASRLRRNSGPVDVTVLVFVGEDADYAAIHRLPSQPRRIAQGCCFYPAQAHNGAGQLFRISRSAPSAWGERVGRKRQFADTGVAAHTSPISIDSEIAHEARKTIPTKRNSVVISIARKAAKCRNGC